MSRCLMLRDRQGVIRAYAVVDDEDFEAVSGNRWCLQGTGYVCRRKNGRVELLHRVLLGLAHGDPLQGDHIDLNPLNNRRANLRIVTGAQNSQNQGSRGGRSKHRGVHWYSRLGMWSAEARVGDVRSHLGYFHNEEDAARVVTAWRAAHMPFSEEARQAAA